MDFWVIYKWRLFSTNHGYFSTNRGCGMIQYGMFFLGIFDFLLASLTTPLKFIGIFENSRYPKPTIETSWYRMRFLEIHFGSLQNPAPSRVEERTVPSNMFEDQSSHLPCASRGTRTLVDKWERHDGR